MKSACAGHPGSGAAALRLSRLSEGLPPTADAVFAWDPSSDYKDPAAPIDFDGTEPTAVACADADDPQVSRTFGDVVNALAVEPTPPLVPLPDDEYLELAMDDLMQHGGHELGHCEDEEEDPFNWGSME